MTGDEQVAAELREIAAETECPQRKMHLEIAAQIVEQGRFMHPNDFGMQVEIDSLRGALTRIADHCDPHNPESYRSDDREGCLETCWAVACDAIGRPHD